MPYDVPGRADNLSATLVRKWNDTIKLAYERQQELVSRFFTLDPDAIANPTPAAIQWFADPAEPRFCIGLDVARQLSDWGITGRHAFHNEYCEYVTVQKPDASGRMRPKRVQVTTELREYWVFIAQQSPNRLRAMVKSILGYQPRWEDLYGVSNPSTLTTQQRAVAFSTLVAGNGQDPVLKQAGVPSQPTGKLNTESALFMTHPINGLDDLLYIVMFGAKPYARHTAGVFQAATREEIFREYRVEALACRHADPAAAMGAHGAVFNGRPVAFANPLGMYIRSFANQLFLYNGNPVPDAWVRWSRGTVGMYQRLEFGPGDNEDVFLDDIKVAAGAVDQPVTGGFQVLQQLEVGPLVVVGEATPLAEDDYTVVTASSAPIPCHEAAICTDIKVLKEKYDSMHAVGRIAPRRMGIIGG